MFQDVSGCFQHEACYRLQAEDWMVRGGGKQEARNEAIHNQLADTCRYVFIRNLEQATFYKHSTESIIYLYTD